MSNDSRVDQLITSILQIEREYLRNRLSTEPIAKKQAVKAILEEVEEIMENENKSN